MFSPILHGTNVQLNFFYYTRCITLPKSANNCLISATLFFNHPIKNRLKFGCWRNFCCGYCNGVISNGGEWKINNLHTRYRCRIGNLNRAKQKFQQIWLSYYLGYKLYKNCLPVIVINAHCKKIRKQLKL
jgi:hypothetical protein